MTSRGELLEVWAGDLEETAARLGIKPLSVQRALHRAGVTFEAPAFRVTEPRACSDCGRDLFTEKAWAALEPKNRAEQALYGGDGMCKNCYGKARAGATIHEAAREEWPFLAAAGTPIHEAAERLHVSVNFLERIPT